MALAGQQTVHVLASPDGDTPISTSPFPAVTAASPSPTMTLLTAMVQSVVAVSAKSLTYYPTAGARINVMWQTGNAKQSGFILVSESVSAVNAAL